MLQYIVSFPTQPRLTLSSLSILHTLPDLEPRSLSLLPLLRSFVVFCSKSFAQLLSHQSLPHSFRGVGASCTKNLK
jgi:hypothetical protein